ncbi:hypothetical protein H9L25_00320 [Terrisporobacter mayombei]|nr:hypothetical protein [Terrisporobacter mayombei]
MSKLKISDNEKLWDEFLLFCPKLAKAAYDCNFNRANCHCGVCFAKYILKNYEVKERE